MAGAGHFNPEAAPLKRLFAEMPEPVRLLRPRRRERPSVRPASGDDWRASGEASRPRRQRIPLRQYIWAAIGARPQILVPPSWRRASSIPETPSWLTLFAKMCESLTASTFY